MKQQNKFACGCEQCTVCNGLGHIRDLIDAVCPLCSGGGRLKRCSRCAQLAGWIKLDTLGRRIIEADSNPQDKRRYI